MIEYEWCIEQYTNDEYQDITGSSFTNKLSLFVESDFEPKKGHLTRLVLIRDQFNSYGGLVNRYWAYVKDKKLPEYFSDARDVPVNVRVPKKFHIELDKLKLVI